MCGNLKGFFHRTLPFLEERSNIEHQEVMARRNFDFIAGYQKYAKLEKKESKTAFIFHLIVVQHKAKETLYECHN